MTLMEKDAWELPMEIPAAEASVITECRREMVAEGAAAEGADSQWARGRGEPAA